MAASGRIIQHGPWVFILLLGLAFNWFWWMDAALFPAVTVHHERTEVLNRYMVPQSVFRPGDEVLIRGHGRVNRVCDKTYTRILQSPDGTRSELPPGSGTRFRQGIGSNIIVIDTLPTWPTGPYEYISIGRHDCNPPFPKQIIPGFHAKFELRR